MYRIELDVDRHLVKVEMEGFWSSSDFDEFMKNEHAELSRLRCRPGDHILLCDLTKLNVVTAEVAERISRDLNSQGSKDAKWLALVTNSMLLKMQMQRMMTRDNAMIFDGVGAAEAWLFEQSGY
jgi:hypothetical protein